MARTPNEFRRKHRIKNQFGKRKKPKEFEPTDVEDIIAPEDPALAQVRQALPQEPGLVNKIVKLQRENPTGSIPELITLDYLTYHDIDHEYQVDFFGGKRLKGGQVVDFIINQNLGQVLAWRIMGLYHHTVRGRPSIDDAQKISLLGAEWRGQEVVSVVDIWDSRIEDRNRREDAFTAALSGIELGP